MSIIYLEALLKKTDKSKLRLLTLTYLITKGQTDLADRLIKRISNDSREGILKQLSLNKFNEKCSLGIWNEDVLNEISSADSYSVIERYRIITLFSLIIVSLIFFGVLFKIISLLNMPTLYSTLISFVSIVGAGTALQILSNYPQSKLLRFLYVIKNIDIIEKNLEIIKANEESLKDKLIKQLESSGYIKLKDQQDKKAIQKNIEKNSKKLLELTEKIDQVINESNAITDKRIYLLNLLNIVKIKESNLEIFLADTEFGCPKVFYKMNQILSIYYKNYNDEIICKQIEHFYKETLSTLINILTKKKDYKTIGCILYQGYTTNDFHIHETFHNFVINENILNVILSNENKDINDFIKNIPTVLESFQRLVKKSKYPAKLEKMLNQLRASIPLNIYNQMTTLIIGE